MKLSIDSRSINLHAGSGIGTYTKNLVFNLLKIDKKDSFNLIFTGDNIENYNKDNVNITLSSGRHGSFYENFYIPNLLQKENIDLYHIPQNGIGFPFNWDLNVAVTIHDLIPYTMPETVGKGYLNRFLKDMPNIINSAKGIITVSEYSKNDILKFFPSYPADKIFVTPLAADSHFKPLSKDHCRKFLINKYKISDPYILYIGGFSSRKNVEGLIESFAKVKSSFKKPHKLLIAGSLRDEGERLKEKVESMGLSDSIIFTGFLDDALLPIFYSGAEAFVYPSFYEGFGLPPLEAMSCKTPVITSNLTSIPEVTQGSAILIDPHNKDELSDAILKLINDDALKEELKIKGYAISQTFSWERTSKLTLDSYKKILSE